MTDIAVNPLTPPESLKDSTIAYVCWFFAGSVGVHRFYLAQPLWGAAYIALFILGWSTIWLLGLGLLFLVPLSVMWFVDAFLIPERLKYLNQERHLRNLHRVNRIES